MATVAGNDRREHHHATQDPGALVGASPRRLQATAVLWPGPVRQPGRHQMDPPPALQLPPGPTGVRTWPDAAPLVPAEAHGRIDERVQPPVSRMLPGDR